MSKPRISPFFLGGSAGRLFSVLVEAAGDGGKEQAVVYLPPFAEEMNRSRRMAALQARRMAQTGITVLLLDPFGTGDSDGDFQDARWEIWREDVAVAVRWLQTRGYKHVSLWGLRCGALLAMDAATRSQDVQRVVLWQPVLSGDALLTQFLRIRIAAGMNRSSMNRSQTAETTASLKAQLRDGTGVEVAGYELAPELARALSSVRLEPLPVPPWLSIHWFEVLADPSGPPSPASQRISQAWRDRGVSVTVETVAGEPFWALQEITLAPNLFGPTTGAFDLG